jgi:hypothetical protein
MVVGSSYRKKLARKRGEPKRWMTERCMPAFLQQALRRRIKRERTHGTGDFETEKAGGAGRRHVNLIRGFECPIQ